MLKSYFSLLRELLPHRKRLLIVILFSILMAGQKLLVPELITLLQASWDNKDEVAALKIPIFIAAVFAIGAVFRYVSISGMKYIADLVTVGLRRKLMYKYLNLNLGFFHGQERGSGGLISRMLNDIFQVQLGVARLTDLVREPIVVAGMLIWLITIDWKLFLMILALTPITGLIISRIARSLRKYSRSNQESVEEITKVLKESLDGTRVIQSFNLEGEMKQRFDNKADDYLASRKKIISREEATGPISEAIGAISFVAILYYIGLQIIAGKFMVADVMAFVAAIIFMRDGIKKIQESYIQLQQALVGYERVQEVLQTESNLQVPAQPTSFPKDWKEIEFRNVSFGFPGKDPILRNINLTVKRGEVIALVGSSGGGKSTLLNLFLRFFDPTEGSIHIGGVNIAHMTLKDLRANIGLVSQDTFLFGDSIEKNIHAGDFSKPVSQIESAAQLANAHNFVMTAKGGYHAHVGDMGSMLSGGEKQRVSIARAIFKDAPILLLDEATSALDSESEREVQKGLDKLMEGRTAFVIAHRLSTIANADRILVLKKGEIVEEGSHEQLMAKSGEYFRFRNLQ